MDDSLSRRVGFCFGLSGLGKFLWRGTQACARGARFCLGYHMTAFQALKAGTACAEVLPHGESLPVSKRLRCEGPISALERGRMVD
jgi:hypothetical protein